MCAVRVWAISRLDELHHLGNQLRVVTDDEGALLAIVSRANGDDVTGAQEIPRRIVVVSYLYPAAVTDLVTVLELLLLFGLAGRPGVASHPLNALPGGLESDLL